jgi:hypothetical protein
VEEEAEGKALLQIKEKKYADKYRSLNQPIHLIGVEFSRKARNVVGFAVESPGVGHENADEGQHPPAGAA